MHSFLLEYSLAFNGPLILELFLKRPNMNFIQSSHVVNLQNQFIALTKERLELRKGNYSLGYLRNFCVNNVEYEKKIYELEWTLGKHLFANACFSHKKSLRKDFTKPKHIIDTFISPNNDTPHLYFHDKKQAIVKNVWVSKRSLLNTNLQGHKFGYLNIYKYASRYGCQIATLTTDIQSTWLRIKQSSRLSPLRQAVMWFMETTIDQKYPQYR